MLVEESLLINHALSNYLYLAAMETYTCLCLIQSHPEGNVKLYVCVLL